MEKQIKILTDKIKELESINNLERMMIEQSPDAIVYTDINFNIIYINNEAEKLFGWKVNDIRSKSLDILNSSINESILSKINLNWRKRINVIEFEAVTKKKKEFQCELKITAFYNKNREILAYVCIFTDISNLHHIKNTLKETENLYKIIIEKSNDCIIITHDEKIIYINSKVEEMIGTREKVLGTCFSDYLSFEENNKKIFENKTFEAVLIDKNNNKYHVELNNSIINLDGKKCVISFIRNITERKNNEIIKDKNLSILQKALEKTLDGIAILDEKANIVYANESFANIHNYNRLSLINKNLDTLYNFNDISKILKNLENNSWSGELMVKDELEKTHSVTYTKFENDGTSVLVVRDITTIKLYEKNIKKTLEKTRESEKLKTIFLANMSHEIRTPINTITGFAEMLEDKDLTVNEIKSYIKIINRRSKELLKLIQDILDLSKIESGELRINEEEISINDLIDELYILHSNKLKNKVKLKRYKEKEDIKIISDPFRLKQILNNLIGNSVKFTDKGFIRYGYKLKGNKIEFFVEDTGIGIPDEKQDIIFEQFRQVDDRVDKNYGGTGLGLTIVKGLVNLLGGTITFESLLNIGTTFIISLPLKTNVEIKDNILLKEEDNLNIDWSNYKLLLVEDDIDTITLMKKYLSPTKIKIIEAKDGEEAVRKFNWNKDIDIVLMDIRLPKMSGLEVTKIIKQDNPLIPVIANTAHALKNDKSRILSQGCDEYISKPVNRIDLLNLMLKFLASKPEVIKLPWWKKIF